MATYFADHFGIDPALLEEYGAFNISLVNDLPLFIDPFLLFNSEKNEYRQLHKEIIRYLVFLKDHAQGTSLDASLLKAWYCFGEVKQNWLGFSKIGNGGSGLGEDFAKALHNNLAVIFSEFGSEKITRGSHLEKVCLIREGVGRDNISDFTTNLIKGYLCRYTEEFALKYLEAHQRRAIGITRVEFNYETETWKSATFTLPWVNGDYVILTPKDMLTRDENWINRSDLIESVDALPQAIPDAQLRAQVSNYFEKAIPKYNDRNATKKEIDHAAVKTILQFPQLLDYYIRYKEDHGQDAVNSSALKVRVSEQVFIEQIDALQRTLSEFTGFYQSSGSTYHEAHERLAYLKDVIEHKGAHRFFYDDNKPIHREHDLHIIFRLVWWGTPSDVSAEVNDGRGPADFKISRGSRDKTIVEMKLAKNTQLERNLQRQTDIYEKASDAKRSIKVIIFFTAQEHQRVLRILNRLKLATHPDVVLIDARKDNKPSGSKA